MRWVGTLEVAELDGGGADLADLGSRVSQELNTQGSLLSLFVKRYALISAKYESDLSETTTGNSLELLVESRAYRKNEAFSNSRMNTPLGSPETFNRPTGITWIMLAAFSRSLTRSGFSARRASKSNFTSPSTDFCSRSLSTSSSLTLS